MNKKLESLKEKAGGIELGPLELEVLNLQKSIAQTSKDIFDLEQTWLKEQNELVRLTNDKDQLEKETDAMKLKHTILMSRKLRTESKTRRNSTMFFSFRSNDVLFLDTIENMETDCTHLKRQIELLRLDLERLNKLIYKETTNRTALERNNVLAESDFVRELKVKKKHEEEEEEKKRFFRLDRTFSKRKKMRFIWTNNWSKFEKNVKIFWPI